MARVHNSEYTMQLTSRRLWCLFSIVAVPGILALVSCLPVALGDPERAKADPKYVGAWLWSDGDTSNVAIVRPWDAKTYAVHTISFTGPLEQPKVNDRNFFKGWLAEVKGETFLNLQPVETLASLPGEKRDTVYLVAKLKLEGERLTATGLDPSYERFKGLKSSDELERLIIQQSQDPKMWTKPIEARRLGATEMDTLENLRKAASE